jgi:hypothetical protein
MFNNTPSELGGPVRAPVQMESGHQNPPGQTPQQAYAAQNPQHNQLPQNSASPSPTQQRLTAAVHQLRYVKSECLGATNPYLLRDRLVQVIEVLEYILAGDVSGQQSNQVPGNRPQEDHGKAKVQFLGVTQSNSGSPTPFATPTAPINNGDVQFIPAPNGGFSVEGGAGQAVQFFDGPAGSPYAGGNNGGQRVEFYDGPGVAAQNPVSNQPPGAVAQTAPTLSIEAGGTVPPTAPQEASGLPQAAPFAAAMAGANVHPLSDPMPIPGL